MKKLLKYLSPFAPDDSGASAVLYELGGITVICDAGGCAGNVCGFDEPRWTRPRGRRKPSALFSAGLRDMDAILGRDDRLIAKLSQAHELLGGEFTAIIGTPVPAVIATDYKALERMAEKKTGVPCIALPTDGTKYYDEGEELTYLRLFRTFAKKGLVPVEGRLGVIGCTPMDAGSDTGDWVRERLARDGWKEVVTFGMDSGLEELCNVGSCQAVMVMSPAGMKSAEYLREELGMTVLTGCPLPERYAREAEALEGTYSKALVVHQQFMARELNKALGGRAEMVSFFKAIGQDCQRLTGEEDLRQKVLEGGYDLIVGDIELKRAVPEYSGRWLDVPHFAVSGRLFEI